MKLKTDTTLAGRLHASKTHKAGSDPVCPVCIKAAKTDLMKCSLDAVTAAYRGQGDAMNAGITLSALPTGEYYASVTRYPRWQGDKLVVFKAKAVTWEGALREVMGQLLESAEVFNRLWGRCVGMGTRAAGE